MVAGAAALRVAANSETSISLRKIGYRELTRLVVVAIPTVLVHFARAAPAAGPEVVTAGRAGTSHRGPADTPRPLGAQRVL